MFLNFLTSFPFSTLIFSNYYRNSMFTHYIIYKIDFNTNLCYNKYECMH